MQATYQCPFQTLFVCQIDSKAAPFKGIQTIHSPKIAVQMEKSSVESSST